MQENKLKAKNPANDIIKEMRDAMNNATSFTFESAGTVYTVTTHFDATAKSSVFDQLRKLLLHETNN